MGTFQAFEFAPFFTSLIRIFECICLTGPTGFYPENEISSHNIGDPFHSSTPNLPTVKIAPAPQIKA